MIESLPTVTTSPVSLGTKSSLTTLPISKDVAHMTNTRELAVLEPGVEPEAERAVGGGEDGRAPGVTTGLMHYSDWSSQPDVHLACGRWTTPAWTPRYDLPELVYEEDDGDLYTFERTDLVTCEACRKAMP